MIQDRGDKQYLAESVEGPTQFGHAVQTAALALNQHDHHLIAAAFAHDVGHLITDAELLTLQGRPWSQRDELGRGADHALIGAFVLIQLKFPARVWVPVVLHAEAKRYLVATEPTYSSCLSDASARTLDQQGGPMTPAECDRFRTLPWARKAVALRRLDDSAKCPTTYRVESAQQHRGLIVNAINLSSRLSLTAMIPSCCM